MTFAFIPLLPLFSFVLLILAGRRLGKWSSTLACAAMLGSFVLSIGLLQFLSFLPRHDMAVGVRWHWLPFSGTLFQLGLMADPLSVIMCLIVTGIGSLIMLYSTGYMREDPRYSRFFAYLSLFCSAMLLLVLSDNLFLLFVGWEGVGLCSYLLISFWFEKPAAANAGTKAFLTTRVGDLGLLIGILLAIKMTGSVRFSDIAASAPHLGGYALAIALLIFWGAAGKSAQFPLHVWLPDAMEGPTPVSALIHAATMVAAGVYLVARMMPLFLADSTSLLVVGIIACITTFFAGTIACVQTDLKKVLAYSTISQLGFMMLGLASGSAFAGMFHLVTHAWFKALLFLGAGSVIHAVHHQEMTRMGGLWKQMPITALTFTAAAVAMAGVPPFSGFWSKEEILMQIAQFSPAAWPAAGKFFLMTALVTAGLTAFYISRAVILTFWGRGAVRDAHVHESPLVMTIPLLILMVGALGIGFLGTRWSGEWLQHFLQVPAHVHEEGLQWIGATSIGIAASGIGLAFLLYGLRMRLLPEGIRRMCAPIYRIVANKYYVDEIYEALLVGPMIHLARRAFSLDEKVIDAAVNQAGVGGLALSRFKGRVDQVVVDGAVNGVGETVTGIGAFVRFLQTGLVQNYLLIACCGAIICAWVMK